MENTEHILPIILFALTLWLKCAAVGLVIGAAAGAAQVFFGRWHPAWGARPGTWFSGPFFSGVACGVLLALIVVPPQFAANPLWLVLCLVVTGFNAALAAGVVAFLSRNYNSAAASNAKRLSRRHAKTKTGRIADWEEDVRGIFRGSHTTEATPPQRPHNPSQSSSPRTKTKLPPERFPGGAPITKAVNYAGKPQILKGSSDKSTPPPAQ